VADVCAASRSTPFLRTAAAAAGGAAQLRGRENPSKIGRLAHRNFAQYKSINKLIRNEDMTRTEARKAMNKLKMC
jgi:hypothetical protein